MRRISVCFLLAGLSQAVQVYLNPLPSLPPNLSPSHASFILSRHLGLEFFESARNEVYEPFLNEQAFVGQGSRSALLLSIDEQNARGMYMGRSTLLNHRHLELLPCRCNTIVNQTIVFTVEYSIIIFTLQSYLDISSPRTTYVHLCLLRVRTSNPGGPQISGHFLRLFTCCRNIYRRNVCTLRIP